MAKNKIINLEGLIKALNLCNNGMNYLDVMQSIKIPEEQFEPFYKWNHSHHTRNCLIRNHKYEINLVCWEKGQRSPIHDYDSHQAWMHPISGKLLEERFIRLDNGMLKKVSSIILGPNEFTYMHEEAQIHRYTNINEGRSVSLHLYMPPVEKWTVYNELTGAADKKEVWWDSSVKKAIL